ncbi:MAG TPA: MlaD family protein [Candidatus Kapabacteria bacterium]|nr:MlaD family protein [Candidatus Kapabacteria bacterium]HOM04801.1 MlaD family protein [Candidatus Kapabacteria bacterium]HPP39645.1 MlaD family protein [Candidatus Kapabacteria bacterium]
MNKQKKIEIKVGIVSVLAIIILIIGLSLAKGVSITAAKNLVHFRFNNSGGITEGSPVVVNGVRCGVVKSIANNNGSVLITADMESTDNLKADCFARITILEITGGKKIEVFPGKSSEPFDISKEIPGKATADLADLIATLGEVSNDAASLVKNLDTLTQNLNYVMNNKRLLDNLETIAYNTSEMTANLNTFIKDNYNALQNTVSNLSILVSDLKKTYSQNEPKLNKIIGQIEIALTNANELLSKMQNTIGEADRTLANINNITEEVRSGSGLANRLIYDRTLASELDSTLKSINTLLNQIEKHGVNVNVRLGTRP